MLSRLVEAHYAGNCETPTSRKTSFWFMEARTPQLLIKLAHRYRGGLNRCLSKRPLLALARDGREVALAAALAEEERKERAADSAYWDPLKRELEQLRHDRLR